MARQFRCMEEMYSMGIAELLVAGLEIYAALGAAFAILFLTKGIHRVDPNARGSTLGFHLIVLPGVAALWPLLLGRWIRA